MSKFLIKITPDDVKRAKKGEGNLFDPLYHCLMRELTSYWTKDWQQWSFIFDVNIVAVLNSTDKEWLKFKVSKKLGAAILELTKNGNYNKFPCGKYFIERTDFKIEQEDE